MFKYRSLFISIKGTPTHFAFQYTIKMYTNEFTNHCYKITPFLLLVLCGIALFSFWHKWYKIEGSTTVSNPGKSHVRHCATPYYLCATRTAVCKLVQRLYNPSVNLMQHGATCVQPHVKFDSICVTVCNLYATPYYLCATRTTLHNIKHSATFVHLSLNHI